MGRRVRREEGEEGGREERREEGEEGGEERKGGGEGRRVGRGEDRYYTHQ